MGFLNVNGTRINVDYIVSYYVIKNTLFITVRELNEGVDPISGDPKIKYETVYKVNFDTLDNINEAVKKLDRYLNVESIRV
jgi:hypothetical protein